MAFIHHIADWFYRTRRKLATGAIFALAVLLGIHVVFGPNGFLAYQKKKAEYRTLGSEVERIQKENDDLTQKIKALKSDPATIEKEAREQLRYARPGEIVYTYPDPAQSPAPPVAAQKR
jgi:cell division protein FtsB